MTSSASALSTPTTPDAATQQTIAQMASSSQDSMAITAAMGTQMQQMSSQSAAMNMTLGRLSQETATSSAVATFMQKIGENLQNLAKN